jgi:Tn3 transposase DDE domain
MVLQPLSAVHFLRCALGMNSLQTALVYVNTLMVQDVLADDALSTALTNEDRRALTPLFWAHVAPIRRDQTRHAQPAHVEHTH